jgi:hypothetical protein
MNCADYRIFGSLPCGARAKILGMLLAADVIGETDCP